MDYLAAVLDRVVGLMEDVDFPAVVLLLLLFATGWAMRDAQKREDFDWGDAFRDENGKVSWFRGGIVVCLMITSWLMIYAFMNGMKNSYGADDLVKVLDSLFKYFAAYLVVWSGAKIVDKMGDVIVKRYFPTTPPPA